jgi:hypothetical protein
VDRWLQGACDALVWATGMCAALVYVPVQETFLSADDLRINLWNAGITEQSFNVVDIKPSNMEDLTEVGGVAVSVQSDASGPKLVVLPASSYDLHSCTLMFGSFQRRCAVHS